MIELEAVRDHLAGLIAEAMYMEPEEIQEDELFSNFGLESLTLLKLVAKLNEHYGSAIQPNRILQHQTLRDASNFVFEQVASIQLERAGE